MQILGTSGEDGSGPWPYQPPQALTNLSVVPSALVVSVTFFFFKKRTKQTNKKTQLLREFSIGTFSEQADFHLISFIFILIDIALVFFSGQALPITSFYLPESSRP